MIDTYIEQCANFKTSFHLVRFSHGHKNRRTTLDEKDVDIEDDVDIEHEPPMTKNSENVDGQPVGKKAKMSKEDRMRMRSKCNCDDLRNVECVLETKDLWEKFHDLETEMIITKTGR